MEKLGERTLTVDCDVLQADGGTRMASITGAYVALMDAMQTLGLTGRSNPIMSAVAGLSAGIRGGDVLLDMLLRRGFRRQRGLQHCNDRFWTAHRGPGHRGARPFSRDEMDSILDTVSVGLRQLFDAQKEAVGAPVKAPAAVLP